MRCRRLGMALGAALAVASGVRAEDGAVLAGTLKAVHDRGTILIGTRDSAPPFSFLNHAGQPIGFSVDLCRGIASDVAAALHVDLVEADAPAWQTGLRLAYVKVAADARLAMLVSGAIDLECGSTTANAERAKTIAFSPVFFLAGTKLLVPAGSGVASYRDLAGHTVAAGLGTTNGAVIHRLASGVTPAITVTETANLNDAYDLLATGKADALASDDILLVGFQATRPDGRRFAVVGDYLSFEPYAIGHRRDDPDFAALVQQSFARMAAEGRLNALYNRWLVDALPTGERMNLPISAQLTEMYRAMGQPD